MSSTLFARPGNAYPAFTSVAESADLVERARAGDVAAVAELVERHEGMVARMTARSARRYRWIDPDDLRQLCVVGLLETIDRFDTGRGAKFCTAAEPGMLSGLVDAARYTDYAGPIRVAVSAAKGRCRTESVKEAARRVQEAVRVNLHESIHPAATGADPAEEAGRNELSRPIRAALDGLGDRDRTLIRLRYGLDGGGERTAEEVGRRMGLAEHRVRRIERMALKKLRRALGGEEADPCGT